MEQTTERFIADTINDLNKTIEEEVLGDNYCPECIGLKFLENKETKYLYTLNKLLNKDEVKLKQILTSLNISSATHLYVFSRLILIVADLEE